MAAARPTGPETMLAQLTRLAKSRAELRDVQQLKSNSF